MTAAIAIDAAVTGTLGTGIDPEDQHKSRGASPRRTLLHTRSRGASVEWREPLQPAKLTSLRWLFAARSAPFADPRSARVGRTRRVLTLTRPRSPSPRYRRSSTPSWCRRAPRGV